MVPAALYDVDVLRTALCRRDLGAELPYLAVLRLSESDPKQTYTTDRYQGGGLHPIRIRTRVIHGPHCRNSLDKRRAWRTIHE